MTYDAHESSVESGDPVEVYEVVAGSLSFFYTSAEDVVTIGAQDYTPAPGLERSNDREGADQRESDFTFQLPTVDPLAQLFVGQVPGFRVRVTVKRFHRSDTPTPEVAQVFDGYVHGVAFEENCKLAVFTSRDLLASLGKLIPRRTYQSACNHVLYHATTCRVNDADPAFRASLISVSSLVANDLTVVGLSPTYSDGWFDGGYVEVVGGFDYRLVLSHVGNVLTLHTPFSTTPSTVNVFAGCAHDIATCKLKFDNVVNYGGFAFVPTRNPHDGFV